MFPLTVLQFESALVEPPLPDPHIGGSSPQACADRSRFVGRLVVRFRPNIPALIARSGWEAIKVLVELPVDHNENPQEPATASRENDSQNSVSGCHRGVGAAFVQFDQFVLLRLQEIWSAAPTDLADPNTHVHLAAEFRWWFELGRLLYPAAAPDTPELLTPATAFPTGEGVPYAHSLHPLFNELSRLCEPDTDVANAGEVFPPAWYWSFCRRHNLTDFQAMLVGFATSNRLAGPPAEGTRIRQPAALAYRRRWWWRWVVYPVRVPLSNFRFVLSCLRPSKDRRFENAVHPWAVAPQPAPRQGLWRWLLPYVPNTPRGEWWFCWLLFLLVPVVAAAFAVVWALR